MADPTTRDLAEQLATLRETVAYQGARLARHERRERRRRLPRRLVPLALAALLVALVPLATLAANPFTDLNPGSPHNGNIDLIFNAGITTGCDPGVAYCPNGTVTREEMASFLARTAGLGTNPPVVNAAAVDGKSANELARASAASGVTSFATGGGAENRPLAALTLDVPAAGYVLLTTTGRATTTATSGCPCLVGLALGTPDDPGIVLGQTLDNAPVGGVRGHSLAETRLLPVSGPGTQTFAVRGARFAPGAGGGGTASVVMSATLTALYIPFGPNGGPTDPLPTLPPQ